MSNSGFTGFHLARAASTSGALLFFILFFFIIFDLLTEDAHADDAGFIKNHEGYCQKKLREHIRRRKDSRNTKAPTIT